MMSTTAINSTSDTSVISAAGRVQTELELLTAKLRRDVWLYGLLAVTATAMSVLLLMIVSDAVFQPQARVLRFVLWFSVLAAVAAAIRRFVWHPLRDRCNTLAVAWSLEEQRPELQESLTSTLLFVNSQQSGASSLVDAVAAQADHKLADCRDDAATRCDLRRPGLATASCAVVTLLCLAVWPQYLLPSLANVMAPWNVRQLPYLTAMIFPGHIAVAEGRTLEVSALGSDLEGSVLEFMDKNTVVSSVPMTVTEASKEASVVLTGLSTDQTYRVRSGSLVSDVYQITVHPRPVVMDAKATLLFPEYSEFPSATIEDLSLPVAVMPGTQVKLSVASRVPLSDARLTFGGNQQGVAETEQAEDAWWHHWNLQIDDQPLQPGRVELISEYGVSSEPFVFEIQSIPDSPPSVSIRNPTLQHLAVPPDGNLAFQFEADDDIGLHSVEVQIQAQDAEPDRTVIMQDLEATNHAAEFTFDPQKHGLKVGDQVSLWFVASDNRTSAYGGAQTAESQRLMITIADDPASIGRQQVIDEESRLLETLSDAVDRLHKAQAIAQQIADATQQAAAQGVPADAQTLQQQLQDVHQTLEKLADAIEDDADLFEDERQQVRNINDEQVNEARHQARIIPLTSNVDQQQQAANAARSAIERAEEQLAALKEQLKTRAKQLQQAAELDELARQQNELARRMEEREETPQQGDPKQEQIADRLQKLVEDDPDAQSEQFLQRAETAEKLAKNTSQLQEQQQQLTNTRESRTDEETREQLARMIQTEQEALAAENQQLLDEARQDEANTGEKDAATDAQQLMEQVRDDLASNQMHAAEKNAENAKQKLQEAASSQAVDGKQKQQPQARQEKRERLAELQERIEQAIRAVNENDLEAAKDELQELITERVEQLAEEAEELLELPADDKENQKVGDETKQKLQQALSDSKEAAAESQNDKPKNASNPEAQQEPGDRIKKDGEPPAQQPGDLNNDPQAKQNEAEQKVDGPKQQEEVDQEKKGQQAQRQPVPRKDKNGEQQAQQPDGQRKDQQAKQNETDPKQAQQEQQPGQQNKDTDQPQDQQENKEQPQTKPRDQPQGRQQQQKKAAQSLKQASESLQQFCKSCRQCANCNKSGQSGSSSGNSRPGNKRPGREQSEGEQSGDKQPDSKASGDSQPGKKQPGGKESGEKQAEDKDSQQKPSDGKPAGNEQPGQSDQKSSGPSRQLAKATDNAQKAARKPTPSAAKQLARELCQLADQAAQNSDYPGRKGSNGEDGRKNEGPEQRQNGADKKSGSPDGSRSPSGAAMGVGRDSQPDDAHTTTTQLRGPSTSEWTRSHRRLKGSVLDSRSTQIPEAYRGVVEDYFEQLSRIESHDRQPEASK